MNALHMSAQMGLFRVAEVLLMDMDFEQEEEEQEVSPSEGAGWLRGKKSVETSCNVHARYAVHRSGHTNTGLC